ncbi:hypothetical protein DSO57_1007300 [Entomophthora muscae]|uniref:Uncharacterized protein n=1 Tax=Entomophthora muscae TaxID=34485 RepID=A0ACC2RM20_9FUNG|nr:hypothetical protein DSO57_1007300 [Entomophthora muscae]
MEHRGWLFEARNNTQHAPLILWINGVPNQPPIFGTSAGMSPCRIENGTATRNVFAWNQNAHVVFFDMYRHVPRIEGISGKYQLLFDFIRTFAEKYPTYVQHGLHIFGQSIDASAAAVVGNMVVKHCNHIQLLSIGLGSPVIDLRIQMQGYPEMMYKIQNDKSLVSRMKRDLEALALTSKHCTDISKYTSCEAQLDLLSSVAFKRYLHLFPSLLDYTASDHKTIQTSNEYFANSLNLSHSFDLKPTLPSEANVMLTNQIRFESYTEEITNLLKCNIPILVFSGEHDYIANSHGIYALLEWIQPLRSPIRIHVHPKNLSPIFVNWGFGNLTHAVITNAGHLVDQPQSVHILINHWIHQFYK